MTDATQRLFFALWPDAATRCALDHAGEALHAAWGGRRMRADSLHLTLAFLGATPTARLDAVCDAAASIRTTAFTLRLDRPGCWKHNRIGWLGLSETPPALALLASELIQALHLRGLNCDAKPFVPHVTLLRNIRCGDAPAIEPLAWWARDFALVASPEAGAGADYRVLATWPLLP